MRYILPIFILVFALGGCSSESTNATNNSVSLEDKRAELRSLRNELQVITGKISQLESEIETLDPNAVKSSGTLVSVKTIEKKHFKRFVEIQGAVEAEDLIDVTSEIPGRVIQMPFQEGDYVKKGQLVAKIDVEQIDKQIAELEKTLELATTVFERQERLWNQNIGSEIQFLEAKNNKERLEKSLETLNFQLTKANVYAPAGGVVERVMIQSGEVTGAGTPIIQILNTSKLKVVADVPETLLRAVKLRDIVTVKFPALGLEQNASVNLIGRTIDPSNRTFKVEAALTKANRLLKPNLLSIMLVEEFDKPDAITVPVETVLQEVGGKDYVFIVQKTEEGAMAKKVYIQTGESYEGEIIVEEGLDGTETLITEGARNLADKEPIEVFGS